MLNMLCAGVSLCFSSLHLGTGAYCLRPCHVYVEGQSHPRMAFSCALLANFYKF